jgi:hypothetical protein
MNDSFCLVRSPLSSDALSFHRTGNETCVQSMASRDYRIPKLKISPKTRPEWRQTLNFEWLRSDVLSRNQQKSGAGDEVNHSYPEWLARLAKLCNFAIERITEAVERRFVAILRSISLYWVDCAAQESRLEAQLSSSLLSWRRVFADETPSMLTLLAIDRLRVCEQARVRSGNGLARRLYLIRQHAQASEA